MSTRGNPPSLGGTAPHNPVAWGQAHAFELLREAATPGVIYAGVWFPHPAAEPEKGAKKP